MKTHRQHNLSSIESLMNNSVGNNKSYSGFCLRQKLRIFENKSLRASLFDAWDLENIYNKSFLIWFKLENHQLIN